MARYILPLLGLTSLAWSQSLYSCDGLRRPNWDTCDDLMEYLDWDNSVGYVQNEDAGGGCSAHCKVITLVSGGNCMFSVCFQTSTCIGASYTILASGYRHVLSEYCRPIDSGGIYTPGSDSYELQVTNNPNYTPDSTLLQALSFHNKTHDNGVLEFDITLEDMEILLAATANGNSGAPAKEKRQQDGDDFTLLAVEYNRINPDVSFQASPILSSGVEYTWSFSETLTVSTTVSAEVSASLFEVFSVSAGIERTREHSETVEEGLTFTVGDCPDEAVVYFYPLFDRYEGYWSSQETSTWSAWFPVRQGDYVAGRFMTTCLGL